MMRTAAVIAASILTGLALPASLAQQPPAAGVAPAGTDLRNVWHLGRVTGDLERILQFYVDLLGINVRGERHQPIAFYTAEKINEFVNAPANAEFRAAFMPIQGTSAETEPARQIYLEAFEYRNIDRRLIVPPLSSVGVSSLKFLVRDVDDIVTRARGAGVTIVTAGGQPVAVPAPAGFAGDARAIMLRDPDGYAVQVVEVTPPPQRLAPDASNVLGAHMSVIVADVDASVAFYRRLAGSELAATQTSWQNSAALSALRNIPTGEYRTASLLLPGSAVSLELIELRGIEQSPYRPVFQDIGHGHVAFTTGNIETVLARMRELGIEPLSQSGSWTQINANLRAIYTRDRDGFFIEIIERP